MSNITVAAIQMHCNRDVMQNIERAKQMVEQAADQGAQIILLPELFERPYFCQEKRYGSLEYAVPCRDNPAVVQMQELARKREVVIPVSYYEKDGLSLYNSVAVVDATGEIAGNYRKTHIPDDHFYQEKFYFTPGNTGFMVIQTRFAAIGMGICWDQWFPETARCLTLAGAQILMYPTAIGSEPILACDSMPHWQRCMQGHAAANIIPVVAANRVGTEEILPDKENADQHSSLDFYGSSFITDDTGEILQMASRTEETILLQSLDLDASEQKRREWGVFRDRRPEQYHMIVQ